MNADLEARVISGIIAASGPSNVDDLTTFLRKRFAEQRAEAHKLPLKQAEQAVASIDVQEEILDELDAAVLMGKARAYIDGLLFTARKLGSRFETHPNYHPGWRP
jgi:hypothetical protein